ncbi:disulfide bond formation protein B [Piscinibacter koreensis]|uniref:Disulfide bond formation protein B n=1 Tax=Piscinibacter koreensis TaxID=2742824 RepID=A0A7Y6NL06_9BURK|nr:disulfide bond formation protein B [Schlegelella koreensis]NUZ05021.1 disulfide bond formation protein B [Schlegelella koreensis]
MSTRLPSRSTAADAPRRRSSLLLAVGALFAFGAVGAALVSQHVFGMDPCPWCVLQRAIFVAIGIAALLGLLLRSAPLRSLMGGLGLLLALGGIAAALWQHFVAAASASCNLTLADRIVGALRLDSALPDVFAARASCADAAVDLLGIPYDFWSLAAFVILALLLVRVLALQGRVARLARR